LQSNRHTARMCSLLRDSVEEAKILDAPQPFSRGWIGELHVACGHQPAVQAEVSISHMPHAKKEPDWE